MSTTTIRPLALQPPVSVRLRDWVDFETAVQRHASYIPMPQFVMNVQNHRIANLYRNPQSIHMALLSLRIFGGEFDCPADHVWGYRVAEACVKYYADSQGEANLVLARCYAQGLGGVKRNLPIALRTYVQLQRRSSALPAWVLPSVQPGINAIKTTAACIVSEWKEKIWRRRYRKIIVLMIVAVHEVENNPRIPNHVWKYIHRFLIANPNKT